MVSDSQEHQPALVAGTIGAHVVKPGTMSTVTSHHLGMLVDATANMLEADYAWALTKLAGAKGTVGADIGGSDGDNQARLFARTRAQDLWRKVAEAAGIAVAAGATVGDNPVVDSVHGVWGRVVDGLVSGGAPW